MRILDLQKKQPIFNDGDSRSSEERGDTGEGGTSGSGSSSSDSSDDDAKTL